MSIKTSSATTQRMDSGFTTNDTLWSYCGWLKYTGLGPNGNLLHKTGGTSVPPPVTAIQISGGEITMNSNWLLVASVSTSVTATSGAGIVANTLYHFAVTMDFGTYNNVAKIYINGVDQGATLTATPTVGSSYIQPTGNWCHMNKIASGDGINGTLEDARIYGRILSANEIMSIYSQRGRDGNVNSLRQRILANEEPPANTATTGDIKDIGPGQYSVALTATSGTITYDAPIGTFGFRRRTK